MSETIKFEGSDIYTVYGARVIADSIEISGTPITNSYLQGRNRTNYIVQTKQYGLKTIKFRVCFFDSTRALCEQHKQSIVYGASRQTLNLGMPDGFYYRVMLKKIGKEEWLGSENNGGVLLFFDLEFEGIQQGAAEYRADGRNSFTAVGTFPKMDCILTTTVGASASHYYLFGADFGSVTAGDVLVFDGIKKRILKNGSPTIATGYFEFPYVTTGTNQFVGDDPIEVDYFPCYL